MPSTAIKARRRRTAFCAFSLAALSCVLGLSLCLIKSPQSRSDAYLAMAYSAMEQGRGQEAAAVAIEAVRLYPASPKGWMFVSEMLRSRGDDIAARQAMAIAGKLQQNPAPSEPIYAMPAELRLSFLAMADKDIR